MRYISILLAAATVLLPVQCRKADIGHTSDCSFSPATGHPKAAVYQAVLDQYVARGLPGISALVRDDYGLWVGSAGKADISKNIDMHPCTVSKACSITKTFVGTLALKLVEEGKFGLDDPVSKWVPSEVTDHVKNVRESTVRMLLNHTSGIAELIEDQAFYLAILNEPDRKWTPGDLIKFVYDDDPMFPPGADVDYSNTNFLLLAMIIEKATGQDHAQLLHEMVIDPLHLGNTYYYWHDPLPDNTAQGYFDLYNNGTILNVTNYNTGSGNGYGGLYSNVYDLQTFIEALVRDKTLLLPQTLAQMQTLTDSVEGSSRRNGLGIIQDFFGRDKPDEWAWGHRGRDLGYTADMDWFPNQDYTMVYFVNYGTDAKSELRQTFYEFRTAFVDALMQQ
ncbi:MAG: serine hydrolase domain-containing protein [Saprospiraceae bacterium]